MRKNFNKMNKKIFKILILIILVSFYLKNVIASENKIIFKINDNAFTLLDLEKRTEYLDFVGNNSNIDKKIIIEDYISANLFYEYFKKSKNSIDYEDKIEEIFFNIIDANKLSNKIYTYEINKELIMNNIRIDFIRKIILENILNSSINNLNTSKEEIDLLYNLKIKYINLKLDDYSKYKNKIDELENITFNNLQFFLDKNNINFFIKETEINNINKIRKDIRENILLNNNFFIIKKMDNISIIFIEKNFETFDGIIADLYSVKTIQNLTKEFLNCKNLIKQNNPNIINKEYKLIDLNNDLKENLININDYVKFDNGDENIYIVLCNIKFDKDLLNNINFNKIINLNISELEKKFINKYSETYNLIIFNE